MSGHARRVRWVGHSGRDERERPQGGRAPGQPWPERQSWHAGMREGDVDEEPEHLSRAVATPSMLEISRPEAAVAV